MRLDGFILQFAHGVTFVRWDHTGGCINKQTQFGHVNQSFTQ